MRAIVLKKHPLKASNYKYVTGGRRFAYRIHPISGIRELHEGVDLIASWGDNVYAVEKGTVIVSKMQNNYGGYGNYVVIQHDGYQSIYAHLSMRIATVGQVVEDGQLIAYVGSTGSSTGAHLHFGMGVNFFNTYDRGWFNPLPYLKGIGKVVEVIMDKRYNSISEMPNWAKGTVRKLVNKDILKGDTDNEADDLDLSEDMLRILVILDRAGSINSIK